MSVAKEIVDVLLPLAVTTVVPVGGIFFATAMRAVSRRFGAQTEQLLREELGKALSRGLAQVQARPGAKPGDVQEAVTDYLLTTMPQTIARLGVSRQSLGLRVAAEIAAQAAKAAFDRK